VVERKMPELESFNLFKANSLMEEIVKEVDKY